MKYSVVGLPHYTIWHLYEPSVDDIRHMEEMEQERLAKEGEAKAKEDRLQRLKDNFENPSEQWRKDKADIRNIAKTEYMENEKTEGKDGKTSQKESAGQDSKDTSVKQDSSAGKESSGKKESSDKESSPKKVASDKESSSKKVDSDKESSPKKEATDKSNVGSSQAKAEKIKEEQAKKNSDAIERAKAAHAKVAAEAEEKKNRDGVTGEKKADAPL